MKTDEFVDGPLDEINAGPLANDPFTWVAEAADDRVGDRPYLDYVYATGSEIVGADGHRMHIAPSDLSPGFYDPVDQRWMYGPNAMDYPDYSRYILNATCQDLIANMTRTILGPMPSIMAQDQKSNMVEVRIPQRDPEGIINLCEAYLDAAMAPADEATDTIGIFHDDYQIRPQQARLDMATFGGCIAVIMGVGM